MKKRTVRSVFAGALLVSLLVLCGCKADPQTLPAPVTGGKVDHSHKAPTEIRSRVIVSFSTGFYRYNADDPDLNGGFYTFEVTPADGGRVTLKETKMLNIECEADGALFDGIYDVLDDYDLLALNGTDRYTGGLPVEYQPCSVEAAFDSGENLYFRVDGDPFDDWSDELAHLFADAFEDAGDTRLRDTLFGPPQELNGAVVMEIAFNEIGSYMTPWVFIENNVDSYYCCQTLYEEDTEPLMEFSVSIEEGQTLIDALVQLGVLDWDGFSRSKSLGGGILDADKSFSFRMCLDDGREINASGYNSFPENYSEVKTLLWDFFENREPAVEEPEAVKDIEAVVLKDAPAEGDLIRGKTFCAQLPRSRYGGNCEEGDYAAGRFLIWVSEVTLSDAGGITARGETAVPYIVSDHGNDENLSMLSGGMDGDNAYGDDIWEITTDENGEIVDAVFVGQP